jgi:hypothetical protein
MVTEKSWEDFRESGLLWWINMVLHTFGWAIVYEFDEDEKVIRVFPSRVKFRGFSEEFNTEGYEKVSKYMKENAKKLYDESKE